MRFMVLVLGGLCLVFSPLSLKAEDTATVPNCTLAPEEEAQIPAQEAGVLTKILVHEGEQVSAQQRLALIDDAMPKRQRDVAYFKFRAAKKKSETDVDVRFAEEAAKVAKVEYDLAEEANRKVPGTMTHSEILRRFLDWEKMKLSIEKAKEDRIVAGLDAQQAEAELRLAEANLERRQITAPSWFDREGKPSDAVVVELTQHVGQWVQSGEPVMRLVRMDRLRVNGVLDATKFRPSKVQDRPVVVTVVMPHAEGETPQEEKFTGKIVYVKPLVEGGYLQVRAEVQNRKEDGVWVLNPGMNVDMTIQLK